MNLLKIKISSKDARTFDNIRGTSKTFQDKTLENYRKMKNILEFQENYFEILPLKSSKIVEYP